MNKGLDIMKESSCPECGYRLRLGAHPYPGQPIRCPNCETRLVIISLNPLEVDVALEHQLGYKSGKRGRTVEIACPECDELIKVSVNARLGQPVECQACQTVLEVVSTDPLDLDVALVTSWKQSLHRQDEWVKENRRKSSPWR